MKRVTIFNKITESSRQRSITLATICMIFSGVVSCTDGVIEPDYEPLPFMSEQQARTIIEQAFSDRGITLAHDVAMSFFLPQVPDNQVASDTLVTFPVDGFNDSLKIGYEYVAIDNEEYSILKFHDSDTTGTVRFISEVDDRDTLALKTQINHFIDSLKSAGFVK